MDCLPSWGHREWLIIGAYVLLGAVILFLTFMAHKMLDYIQEQARIGECRHQHLRDLTVENHSKLADPALVISAFSANILEGIAAVDAKVEQLAIGELLNNFDTLAKHVFVTMDVVAAVDAKVSALPQKQPPLPIGFKQELAGINAKAAERHKELKDAYTATLVHVKSAIASSERSHGSIANLARAESVARGGILDSIDALAKRIDSRLDHFCAEAHNFEKKKARALTLIASAVGVDTSVQAGGALK